MMSRTPSQVVSSSFFIFSVSILIFALQNASSSANYDVELFHVAEAHAALQGDTGDLLLTKEECDYDTLCLIIIILIISVIIR